jgi:hypothetical protein
MENRKKKTEIKVKEETGLPGPHSTTTAQQTAQGAAQPWPKTTYPFASDAHEVDEAIFIFFVVCKHGRSTRRRLSHVPAVIVDRATADDRP